MAWTADLLGSETRKPRLILHAGASKTGSTSLQTYLDNHRADLMARGFLYPAVGVREGWMPKHQWLADSLLADDEGKLRDRIRTVLRERDAGTHTIILSTEGIFNHWWDFSPKALAMLSGLNDLFEVSCWIWFREPVAFFQSYYLQILKNGRHPVFEAYGQDRSPLEMLETPWVARHLDYQGLLNGLGQVFGSGALYPFAYTNDIVGDLGRLLPLPPPHGTALKVNATTTVTSAGVEMLRLVNRWAANNAEKQAAWELAVKALEALPGATAPFELGREAEAVIAALNPATAESLAFLGAESFARWVS